MCTAPFKAGEQILRQSAYPVGAATRNEEQGHKYILCVQSTYQFTVNHWKSAVSPLKAETKTILRVDKRAVAVNIPQTGLNSTWTR